MSTIEEVIGMAIDAVVIIMFGLLYSVALVTGVNMIASALQ